MHLYYRKPRRATRRGVVAIQIAVCSTVLFGLTALVIDVARLYTTQTELQAAADSAALAAAAQLAGGAGGTPEELARTSADDFAHRNSATGYSVRVLDNDVEFGRAIYDAGTSKFTFQPGGTNYDAVRVTVRHTDGQGLVTVPFLFAPILGKNSGQVQARAAALLIPRDIAVVIDLSGSMNDDSELRHYKQYLGEEGQWRSGIEVNLRDIWCALDGPEPSRPYVPGAEDETEYATDTGPTIGALSTWGSPVVPETYNPSSDPGLWYIKKSTAISGSTLTTIKASLQARGCTTDETNCLVSTAKDASYSNQYRNRTLVICGMATWKSGRAGGRPGGNGDAIAQDNELTWAAYPAWRSGWCWTDYYSYVTGSSSEMYSTNSAFRYRYGLKTFVNFLLENESRFADTNNLWQTPEQPLRATKDAVQAMTDVIVGLESMDHMSLEIFAQTSHHEVNLSENLQSVPDRLYAMQSAHYDSYTNMAGGLQKALNELQSTRARNSSAKVIVMMSDGKPNINESGQYAGEGAPEVTAYVKQIAQQCADRNIRIYTISVGGDADQVLMTEIATLSGGQHFHAEGTPAEYSDELDLIFRSLGGKRPVALIE